MNYEQFENELKAKYPDLFDGHDIGLWVGEGWQPIILSLCRQINTHIKFINSKPSQTPVKVTVSQIKEKFGGLRFYYDGGL